MRIILHIGLHKTGTSALQVFLRDNAKALARHGVLYRTPRPALPNHHGLASGFTRQGHPSFDVPSLMRDLVRDAVDRDQTLLISSEMLSEDRVHVEPFLALLRPHPITAVAYVRRPDDFLLSAYNYQVRDWLSRRTEPVQSGLGANYQDLTFTHVLSRWQRKDVGLVLAPYHPPQWRGGTLFSDFLAMLGIDDMTGFAPMDRRVNRGWPGSLIESLRVVNRLPMEHEAHKQLIADLEALWEAQPDAFPDVELLSAPERNDLRQALAAVLPKFRPYYRSGFDEAYLTEPVA